jgi:D-amino-acid oxidase
MLLAEPRNPLTRMYMQKINNDEFTHIFPRPLGGGIIIGGVRLHHDYNEEPDMDLAERIKKRACDLCPELGTPESLEVIRHNVGFRRWFINLIHLTISKLTSLVASRKGGARIERENRHGKWLIHNYGAGGTGYQASWYESL